MQANYVNTVVVIPLHNCGLYLERLLREIRKYFTPQQLITVNDGSVDNTVEICRSFSTNLLDFAVNRGKGAVLKAGFKHAFRSGYKYAISIDGDLQHNPDMIPAFIQNQNETGADMVIGKRCFSPRFMPFHRILSNSLTSGIVSLRTGRKIYDSQSGYRLYNLDVFNRTNARTDKYQFETEIILLYADLGAKFSFLNIETIYNGQKSYISHFRDIGNFIKLILNYKRGKNEDIINK